jgi:hypothetical protein
MPNRTFTSTDNRLKENMLKALIPGYKGGNTNPFHLNYKLELVIVERFYPETNEARVIFRDTVNNEDPVDAIVNVSKDYINEDMFIDMNAPGSPEICPITGRSSVVPGDVVVGFVIAIGGDHIGQGSVLIKYLHFPERNDHARNIGEIILHNKQSTITLKESIVDIVTPSLLHNGQPIQGQQGPPGPKGDKGDQGDQGIQGQPGEDGQDGRTYVGGFNIPDPGANHENCITSHTISNLNGDVDGLYEIEYSILIHGTNDPADIELKPNGSSLGEFFVHWFGYWLPSGGWTTDITRSTNFGLVMIRGHGNSDHKELIGKATFFVKSNGVNRPITVHGHNTIRDSNSGFLKQEIMGYGALGVSNLTSFNIFSKGGANAKMSGWLKVYKLSQGA